MIVNILLGKETNKLGTPENFSKHFPFIVRTEFTLQLTK